MACALFLWIVPVLCGGDTQKGKVEKAAKKLLFVSAVWAEVLASFRMFKLYLV